MSMARTQVTNRKLYLPINSSLFSRAASKAPKFQIVKVRMNAKTPPRNVGSPATVQSAIR